MRYMSRKWRVRYFRAAGNSELKIDDMMCICVIMLFLLVNAGQNEFVAARWTHLEGPDLRPSVGEHKLVLRMCVEICCQLDIGRCCQWNDKRRAERLNFPAI